MGTAADPVTELCSCRPDLCRGLRQYIITPSLRDGLLFSNVFQALRARLPSCRPSGTKKTNPDYETLPGLKPWAILSRHFMAVVAARTAGHDRFLAMGRPLWHLSVKSTPHHPSDSRTRTAESMGPTSHRQNLSIWQAGRVGAASP